eukprot:PhF_6_TR26705/c1_g4_i3/m.39023
MWTLQRFRVSESSSSSSSSSSLRVSIESFFKEWLATGRSPLSDDITQALCQGDHGTCTTTPPTCVCRYELLPARLRPYPPVRARRLPHRPRYPPSLAQNKH